VRGKKQREEGEITCWESVLPEIPNSIAEPKQLAHLPQQKCLAGEVIDAISVRRIDEPRVTKRMLLHAYET